MTSSDLLELWKLLARDSREGVVQVKRRILPDLSVDLFAFHSVSDNIPGFFIGAKMEKRPATVVFAPCRGIRIEAQVSTTVESHQCTLSIALEDPNLLGVFAVLCADLIATVATLKDVELAYVQAVNRLVRWLTMFDRALAEGLSRERRIGLFGEMHILSLLMRMISPDRAVPAWHGWDAQHQDFSFGGLGLEVKTSSAKRHARISIASEKQLDEKPWTNLVLAYVSVDVNVPDGLTLPGIIESIRNSLTDFPSAKHDFDLHLLEVGYTDVQAKLYEQETLMVRKVAYFEVRDDFPRLTDEHLPAGVGDVNYTIIASDLGKFELDHEQMHELVGGQPLNGDQ